VDDHGGRVWVDDGGNGGATFVMELPVRRPTSAVREDALDVARTVHRAPRT
jgi:K+-sensing histidine kinase KdpD